MRAKRLTSFVAVLLFAGAIVPTIATAQQAPAQAAPAAALSSAQLDQLVAPIALYPDALLAQVLMASTYPIEIVEAERFAEQNKGLAGAQLTQALATQNWDPSIKALVSTPSVLQMMNAKLDWTQELGNAVVAEQSDVMAAVQRLRQKAQAAGNLKSTKQQNVVADGEGPQATIVIEPAEPEVVYVPYYDPAVVYGAWPYPAYPPYYFPAPVGYVAGAGLWFGAGFALGVGWDHWGNWGAFNWHGGNIYVHGNGNNHWQVDANRRVNVNNVNVNVDKSIDNNVNKLDDRDTNVNRDVDRADDNMNRDADRDDDVSRDLNRDLDRDDNAGRDDGFGHDEGFGRGGDGGFGHGGGGGGRR